MEDGMLSYAAAGMFTLGTSCATPLPASETRISILKPSPSETIEALDDECGDDAMAGLPPPIVLDARQWEWLHNALNEPILDDSRLHRLLTEPGVCGWVRSLPQSRV